MAKPLHSKVRGEAAHATHTKDFLRLVDDIARNEGWRAREVVSRWLEASCVALRGATLHHDRIAFDANEARYMKVVHTCKDPQTTMRQLGEMLGVVVEALEAEASDFLSPVFMEVSSDGSMGQFFTPFHLSVVSARMILGDAKEMLERATAEGQPFIFCAEPACGVGGMVLAANQVFRDVGICPSMQVHWDAADLDWEAVCGAYIQLTLTGSSAVVRHANTLSLEEFAAMPTLMAHLFPKRMRRVVESTPAAAVEAELIAADQVGQFGFDFTAPSVKERAA